MFNAEYGSLRTSGCSSRLAQLVLLFPVLATLFVFFAIPLLDILFISVYHKHFTLQYYAKFFAMPAYIEILRNTFLVSLEVTVICLLLGYPVAYVLARSKGRSRTLLMMLVLIPFWMSFIIRTFTWIVLLQQHGIVNSILMAMNVIRAPLTLVGNEIGVIIGMVHVLLPFIILPLYASLDAIDDNLSLAANSLGANPVVTFLRVTLPLSLPGMITGSLLVFIIALGYYVTPELLGGSSSTMISQLIATQIDQELNWEFGAAVSVILLLCVFLVLAVFNKFFSLEKISFHVG